MAADWPNGTLRDAIGENGYIRGPFGSALRRPEMKSSGVPVYEQQHAITGTRGFRFYIDDEKYRTLKRFTVQPNDLIISCSGTLARVSMIRPEDPVGVISQALLILRPDTAVAWPKYLYYFMSSKRGYDSLVGVSTGSVQVNIASRAIIEKTELPLPPLAQQRAIAQILGALDDKIELNHKMNDTLEAIARALFKSWFVDFNPVRAKAEGRGTGLPKPIADRFPNSLVDSELGEIPKGWIVQRLSEALSELETGGRPKGGVAKYTRGIPSIGAESIVRLGVFDYSKTKYVPEEYFNAMTKGHMRSRDVLLYKDGGRPGVFEPHVTLFGDGFPFETCGINEHVYRLRARNELGQNFLFFWMCSDYVMGEMRIKGTGVAIPGLNSTQVRSLTTLVPTEQATRVFDSMVNPLITRILMNCKESRNLESIRDTLLPKLISGDLRVPESMIAVEAAL